MLELQRFPALSMAVRPLKRRQGPNGGGEDEPDVPRGETLHGSTPGDALLLDQRLSFAFESV